MRDGSEWNTIAKVQKLRKSEQWKVKYAECVSLMLNQSTIMHSWIEKRKDLSS